MERCGVGQRGLCATLIFCLITLAVAQRVHVDKDAHRVTLARSLFKNHLRDLDRVDREVARGQHDDDHAGLARRRHHALPAVDLSQALREDYEEEVRYGKAVPGGMRFGVPVSVNINIQEHGLWNVAQSSNFQSNDEGVSEHSEVRVWTIKVGAAVTNKNDSFVRGWGDDTLKEHPNAVRSLNFVFEDIKFGEGGMLWIVNEDEYVLGPYTDKNLEGTMGDQFIVQPIRGSAASIVYTQPISTPMVDVRLEVTTVVAGYRGLVDGRLSQSGGEAREIGESARFTTGTSGDCNIDVCDMPDYDHKPQHRGVVVLISGTHRFCSGSMVASASRDCSMPYMLTAAHCISDKVGSTTSYIAMFNFQHDCQNGVIPTHQTCAGMQVVSKRSASDFALMLLTDCPEDTLADYKAYFNGIDFASRAPAAVYGIHHPSGDVKKWSLEDDNRIVVGNGESWRIVEWTEGVTEGGSSGSPLFALYNDLIVGQLWRGSESCTCNSGSCYDEYGQIYRSWNAGTTPTEQLAPYLNPNNLPVDYIDGHYCPTSAISVVPGASELCVGNQDSVLLTVVNYVNEQSSFQLEFLGSGESPFSSTSFSFPNGGTSAGLLQEAVFEGVLRSDLSVPEAGLEIFPIRFTRVSALKGVVAKDSYTYYLTLIEKSPKTPTLSPEDGYSVKYTNVKGGITLSWTASPLVREYVLTLSSSRQHFDENVISSKTFSHGASEMDAVREEVVQIPFPWDTYSLYWQISARTTCVDDLSSEIHELNVIGEYLSCVDYDPPVPIIDRSSTFQTFPFTFTNTLEGLVIQLEHSFAGDLKMEVEGPNGMVVLGGSTCGSTKYCLSNPITFSDSGVAFDCRSPGSGCAAMASDFKPASNTFASAFASSVQGGNGIFKLRDTASADTGKVYKVCAVESGEILNLSPYHVRHCDFSQTEPISFKVTSPSEILSEARISSMFCFLDRVQWGASEPLPTCEIVWQNGGVDVELSSVCAGCAGTLDVEVMLVTEGSPSPFATLSELLQLSHLIGRGKVDISSARPSSFHLVRPGALTSSGAVEISNPVQFEWESAGSDVLMEYSIQVENSRGVVVHEEHSLYDTSLVWNFDESAVDSDSTYQWTVTAQNGCGEQHSDTLYFHPYKACAPLGQDCFTHSECCGSLRCRGGKCK